MGDVGRRSRRALSSGVRASPSDENDGHATRRTVLETERLQVTTWLPEDTDDLHSLHSDPVTMRWVRGGRPETREETEALLANYLAEQEKRGWTKWRVEDPNGALVGRAGFGPHDDGRARELGYTIRRDMWGRGLATEVAAGLVRWHRSHDDAELWAYAAVENVASCRVLEKVGFHYVGRTEHNSIPCALYRLHG